MTDPKPGATYDYTPAPQEVLDRALRLKVAAEMPRSRSTTESSVANGAVTTTLWERPVDQARARRSGQ